MNKLKRITFLGLLFCVSRGFAVECPPYNDVYVNGAWVNSFVGWVKQNPFQPSGQQEGWTEVSLDYPSATNTAAICYYNNLTQRISYKKIFGVLPAPTGPNWIRYDDSSYYCKEDINTCQF